VALADPSVPTKLYSQQRFRYDAQNDGYVCPQEHFLPLSSFDQRSQSYMYRTSPKICNACPVKAECTTSRYGRVVRRSVFQDYLDRVHGYHTTLAYQMAMRKRSVWIEPMFAEAKQGHQMTQFRLRRLDKVNIQALFTAAGQNIKRLLKLTDFIHPLQPTPLAVIPLTSPALKYFGVFSVQLLPTSLIFPSALSTFSTG